MPINRPADLKDFEAEISLTFMLCHPHVVKCFGGAILPKSVLMVMERMGVSLEVTLYPPGGGGGKRVAEATLRTAMHHVACGVSYLHSCGVSHRDLKPGNVMLQSSNGKWKLIDFGLAKIKESYKLSSTNAGSHQGTQGCALRSFSAYLPCRLLLPLHLHLHLSFFLVCFSFVPSIT
jgi:serine/threonine protein kinase